MGKNIHTHKGIITMIFQNTKNKEKSLKASKDKKQDQNQKLKQHWTSQQKHWKLEEKL